MSQVENMPKVKVDIMAGYYEQEGEHSAVEGGIGTQELTSTEGGININLITDTLNTYNLNLGIDGYSSASTDQIDKTAASKSSASAHDNRPHFSITYTRNLKKKQTVSPKFSFSKEFDVSSLSGGLKWTKSFNKENTAISFAGEYFHDTWLLIYPSEIAKRDEFQPISGNRFDSDVRHTYIASFSFSQILNQRIQIAFLLDYVYQEGILWTPFHRVYFDDGIDILKYKKVMPETLPRSRYKVPVGFRFNWFVTDFLVANLYYRYYFDQFETQSHTAELTLPIKVAYKFTFYPFYRIYSQTASKYFEPYAQHNVDAEFFTSDYDLSAFYSQKFGLGIKFSPLMGLSRFHFPSKERLSFFKSIEFRYARYLRSDGLSANIFSFNMQFTF